jgi:dihydrolipoamide dehydrogenase
LPGFEIDGRWVMSSDEFLDLEKLPASVAIIGGGVVGCEFASLLADLGSKVTILEALDAILPGCDEDIVRLIVRSFKKRGIDIVTGAKVESHTPSSDGTVTTVKAGDQSWDVEAVVVSVGRRPRTEGLVDEGVGVQVNERGFVVTDEYQRTGVDGVWAVGDIVAGTPQLAHVGFAEAIVAVKGMLDEPVVPVDNGKVPWAIYCHPEVAFCGMTEAQAKEAGIDYSVGKFPFNINGKALGANHLDGFIKVITNKARGEIVGVHGIGYGVTDLIAEMSLAMTSEATAHDVLAAVHPHPTLSEVMYEATAAALGEVVHI